MADEQERSVERTMRMSQLSEKMAEDAPLERKAPGIHGFLRGKGHARIHGSGEKKSEICLPF
jgi:hypothetical protein